MYILTEKTQERNYRESRVQGNKDVARECTGIGYLHSSGEEPFHFVFPLLLIFARTETLTLTVSQVAEY